MADHHRRWAPAVTLPLALTGLGLSAYLTWVHYAEPRALSCPDTGVINCTKVTTSTESMIFGVIPVALTGAVYFLAMTGLTVPPAWRARSPWLRRARLAGVLAGVGMVCYLVYVEAVVVHAICLYCTAVHVATVALFVAVLAATLFPPLDSADLDPVDDGGNSGRASLEPSMTDPSTSTRD
jgi:uncharacterized membrane protein